MHVLLSDSTASARHSISSKLSDKVRQSIKSNGQIQKHSTGHFGKVFKVENKFDHRTFALKQIKIHPKEDLEKVLQEVENLSKVKYLMSASCNMKWLEFL